MKVRGIRGAVTVEENSGESIFQATRELMEQIVLANGIDVDDVASVFLTMTNDLTADFPAKAVRSIPGWQWVPLMCATELGIENAMPMCIRVLLHINTVKSQEEIQHIYLGRARGLRPDVVDKNENGQ